MSERAYAIDGDAIICGTCRRISLHPDDVYFRYCSTCGLLGPEIRQRWEKHRNMLRELCDEYGRYKKVYLLGENVARAVPTELILTEGIMGHELPGFPIWREEKHG